MDVIRPELEGSSNFSSQSTAPEDWLYLRNSGYFGVYNSQVNRFEASREPRQFAYKRLALLSEARLTAWQAFQSIFNLNQDKS